MTFVCSDGEARFVPLLRNYLRADRKLIHFFGRRADELYFLEQDPGETHNLAAEKPELVARKLEELVRWEQKVRSLYWGDGLARK